MRNKIKIKQISTITFNEGFVEFIFSKRALNLREATIKHYEQGYSIITRYIKEDTPINTITKKTFDNFVIALSKQKLSTQTVYTYARDLKTMLYYFMKMEYMDNFKIELPKVDKKAIETYTDAELKILLKKPLKDCTFVEYRDWTLINFILSTGVRLNSFINIKIKDVDFENEVVYIRTTKNRKALIIPLNKIIIKILRDYLKVRQQSSTEDYLFCTVYGTKLDKRSVSGSLNRYNANRGVTKTGIHRYRHTFAKKWILMGGSVVTLQKILGHSTLLITENYINLLVEDIKKDMNDFNILEEFTKTHIKLQTK